VILTNEPTPKELGFQRGGKLMNSIPIDLEADDDDIIDYFLKN
jgi:hypothetical protein